MVVSAPFCPSAPGRGTAALTLTLLGNKVLPALSPPPPSIQPSSENSWNEAVTQGCLGTCQHNIEPFHFDGSACNPLEREVRATVVSLSTGILNSNETPNRSIKAGARGSNPTQIWVKFVFYLFFFSPAVHYSNRLGGSQRVARRPGAGGMRCPLSRYSTTD